MAHGYHAPIVLSFEADAAGSAPFSLVRVSDGSPVSLEAVEWLADGTRAVIRPSSLLSASTAYRLDVEPSCGACPSVLTFETNATGSPVTSGDFAGKTFVFDLGDATFVRPTGLSTVTSALLAYVIGRVAFVPLEPDESTAELPIFLGALPDGEAQDPCAATVDLPGASYARDPLFEVSAPSGLSLTVGGVSLPFERFELSGAFVPDGSAAEGLVLSASVDTRSLRPLFGELIDDEAGDEGVCVFIGTITSGSVACEACTSGEGAYCLELFVVDLHAETGDATLSRITQEDVEANVSCGG